MSLLDPLYPPGPELPPCPEFPGVFQVGARPWLDLLHQVATLEGGATWSAHFSTPAAVQHLLLAEALDLLLLDRRTLHVRPGARQPALREFWRTGDVEGLSRLMRPYREYRRALESPPSSPAPPPLKVRSALSVAKRLGDVAPLAGRPMPGSANPSLAEIRERLLGAVDMASLTTKTLFERVLLCELGVSPARAVRAWERMVAGGVFAGLEFRPGPSRDATITEVLRIHPTGWNAERVDLAVFQGHGELVRSHRSAP